jgi:hypothetical protein
LTRVLTAFNWSRDIVADKLERGHGHMTDWLDLFPSECGTLVSELALNRRFNRYCEDRGLSPGLDIHSLIWSCFMLGTSGDPDPVSPDEQPEDECDFAPKKEQGEADWEISDEYGGESVGEVAKPGDDEQDAKESCHDQEGNSGAQARCAQGFGGLVAGGVQRALRH